MNVAGDNAGQNQFFPVDRRTSRMGPWWHHMAYIQRKLHQGLVQAIQDLQLSERGRVLDYGCADQPYRTFLPLGTEYVGADLPGNAQADVDIQADGRLEVEDASFDAALSTQVLEHVADPAIYLQECWRALKPGGKLLLSTHGLMIYHADPVDYWRWTGEGLQKILRDTGFEVQAFDGIMGLAPVGLQFFQDALLRRMPRLARAPFALVMQPIIALFDKLHSDASRRDNALVFIARACKPGAGS